MEKSAMNATEINKEDASCQDKKELVICVTGYAYSEPRNKENSFVEELDKQGQKSTGLINFIRTKSTRKVKFRDLKEHSDKEHSVKALPTYKSLDSLGDEPPRYEVVTGKPLHHEQHIENEEEEDNDLGRSSPDSRMRCYIDSNQLVRRFTFGLLFIVLILMLVGILKLKK